MIDLSSITELLESVSPLPKDWLWLVDTCRTILQGSGLLGELPVTMIHGDPWTGNAIAVNPAESILVDWEYAGRGPALLDLGCLLGDCFGYPDQPTRVDDESIAAVLDV